MARRWKRFAAAAALAALWCLPAHANFPGKEMDDTPSMGVFRIVVQSKFAPLFAGAPPQVYDPPTRKFTSPVLYDPHTKIQRSNPFNEGAPEDNGIACGNGVDDTIIGDSDFGVVPAGFDAFSPEVHTNVYRLELKSLDRRECQVDTSCITPPSFEPMTVKAGRALGFSKCPGEIGSHGGKAFPASSFFNMFVRIEVAGLQLYNKPGDPLLVANSNLTSFPPQVVYIHENSSAVRVYTVSAGSAGTVSWSADELFGYLTLAGHGTDIACAGPPGTAPPCEQFYREVLQNAREMVVPVPGMPPWGAITLATLLALTTMAVLWSRRARRAAA